MEFALVSNYNVLHIEESQILFNFLVHIRCQVQIVDDLTCYGIKYQNSHFSHSYQQIAMLVRNLCHLSWIESVNF